MSQKFKLSLETSKNALKRQFLSLTRWVRSEKQVLLTASGVTAFVLVLRFLGLLQGSELAIYDLFFRLRPNEGIDNRILIVTIGEDDLIKYQYPIGDQILNELLLKLQAAKPRVIGIDIYKDIPKPPGSEELRKTFENSKNLIGIELLESKSNRWVKPPLGLNQSQVGFNNILNDSDGTVRLNLLYMKRGLKSNKFGDSFNLKLALEYLKAYGIKEKNDPNSKYLQIGESVFPTFRSNDGAYIRKANSQGGYPVLANFRHPDNFKKVTMGDVLAGRVAVSDIKGKAVLIGYNAPSVKDVQRIPFSQDLFNPPKEISGVELHANFVSQILSAALEGRGMIRVWSDPWEWLWIFAWSLVGASLSWYLRSPERSIPTVILLGAGLTVSSYLAFLLGNWWIPLLPPLLTLIGSSAVIMFYIAHLQDELNRSKEFLQSVINTIADPIFVKDKEHRRIVLNQAYSRFIGASLDNLVNKTDYDLFPTEQAKLFWEQDEAVFNTRVETENEETFTNSEGRNYIIATKRSLHQDAAGNLFLVGVIRDITERKKMEEQLKRTANELELDNAKLRLLGDVLHYQASHDSLTGLPNRKLFRERLTQSLEWAASNNQIVGLLFLDLNGFKAINDALGHHIGDLLLKAVAERLQKSLRGSDTVSRLGGDEFTIILPGIPGMPVAERVANKVKEVIGQEFDLEGQKVNVSTSVGISLYPLDGNDIDAIINHADATMYLDKEENRVSPEQNISSFNENDQ
jgi:diguanylate cyclase (GGDEF)-like protein/PAS domain S-box-containing protein